MNYHHYKYLSFRIVTIYKTSQTRRARKLAARSGHICKLLCNYPSSYINRLQLKHQQSDNYHKHSSKNSLLSSGEPYSQEKAMVAEVTKQSRIETQPPLSTNSTLPPSHSHPQVGRQQQLHATHSNTGKLLDRTKNL